MPSQPFKDNHRASHRSCLAVSCESLVQTHNQWDNRAICPMMTELLALDDRSTCPESTEQPALLGPQSNLDLPQVGTEETGLQSNLPRAPRATCPGLREQPALEWQSDLAALGKRATQPEFVWPPALLSGRATCLTWTERTSDRFAPAEGPGLGQMSNCLVPAEGPDLG